MKIEKYIKDKGNTYKIVIDGISYTLYDDVIVKYSLIMKESIKTRELEEILDYNEKMKSYYDAIKYINRKMRSEKEIREYLKKKGVSNNNIDITVERLKENKFLNEDIYLKAYINDQINLSNHGSLKISNNLIKLGFKEEDINNRLKEIKRDVWVDKIDRYIKKKINSNHKYSKGILKMKIVSELTNLGYEKEMILEILDSYDIIDTDIYKKEYEKIKHQLEKKYSGYELDRKIKEKLYRRGFNVMEYMGGSNEE